MWVNHDELQIKFKFSSAPLIFAEITGFGLWEFVENHSFSKCLQILGWFLVCETTIMFVSTCVYIEIADFQHFLDRAIRVALTHLVFLCSFWWYIVYWRYEISIKISRAEQNLNLICNTSWLTHIPKISPISEGV